MRFYRWLNRTQAFLDVMTIIGAPILVYYLAG